jgi:hypothetical protein
MVNIFRRAYDYLESPHRTFLQQNSLILQPLLVDPAKTIRYYKTELLLGITTNIVYVCFC